MTYRKGYNYYSRNVYTLFICTHVTHTENSTLLICTCAVQGKKNYNFNISATACYKDGEFS